MLTRKKWTQTFIYCNYGNKKKQTHLHHLLYLWQHQKMDSYQIPFIVDVINDCHNNWRAVKGRQQEKKNYYESACDHMAL
jgi:hypothetical protein